MRMLPQRTLAVRIMDKTWRECGWWVSEETEDPTINAKVAAAAFPMVCEDAARSF